MKRIDFEKVNIKSLMNKKRFENNKSPNNHSNAKNKSHNSNKNSSYYGKNIKSHNKNHIKSIGRSNDSVKTHCNNNHSVFEEYNRVLLRLRGYYNH